MSKLITFNTAKLAKEKGFDEETEGYFYPSAFHIDGKPRLLSDDANNINKTYYDELPKGISLCKYNWNSHHPNSDFFAVPTKSELQTWLREVLNLNIAIQYKPNIKKWDYIVYNLDLNGKEYVKFYSQYYKVHDNRRFDSYEDALENGLEEALLIK